MASFLVTGHGRSGTTWCARELNRSMDWLVTHECCTAAVLESSSNYPHLADYRGDVDSRTRLVALGILDEGKVDKLAVILRDPTDIIMSALGRNDPKAFARITTNMDRDLRALDATASDRRVHTVKFTDMVAGPGLIAMARFLGIADMPPITDLSPANGPTREWMPEKQQDRFREKFRWFTERWAL
jgi:hypothetical protein